MTSSFKNNAPLLTWFATSMVVLWLLIAIGPFIWTVWGSFKVEGDFFSKADWRNAIYGVMTIVETGGAFTGNGYYGAAIALVVLAGAITVGSISLASFNPAVTSALIVSGKLTLADSWMHFVPQFVGAVLATYAYKSTQ